MFNTGSADGEDSHFPSDVDQEEWEEEQKVQTYMTVLIVFITKVQG